MVDDVTRCPPAFSADRIATKNHKSGCFPTLAFVERSQSVFVLFSPMPVRYFRFVTLAIPAVNELIATLPCTRALRLYGHQSPSCF